jgi:hypothetical protein
MAADVATNHIVQDAVAATRMHMPVVALCTMAITRAAAAWIPALLAHQVHVPCIMSINKPRTPETFNIHTGQMGILVSVQHIGQRTLKALPLMHNGLSINTLARRKHVK